MRKLVLCFALAAAAAACSPPAPAPETTAADSVAAESTAPPEPVFGGVLAGTYAFAAAAGATAPCDVTLDGLGEAGPEAVFGFAVSEACVATYPVLGRVVGWSETADTITLLGEGGTTVGAFTKSAEGPFAGQIDGAAYSLTAVAAPVPAATTP